MWIPAARTIALGIFVALPGFTRCLAQEVPASAAALAPEQLEQLAAPVARAGTAYNSPLNARTFGPPTDGLQSFRARAKEAILVKPAGPPARFVPSRVERNPEQRGAISGRGSFLPIPGALDPSAWAGAYHACGSGGHCGG
jgi:hypothetical protein